MRNEDELRETLLTCLKRYSEALASGEPGDRVDAWIGRMDELVPHAKISDLYFWGERERSDREVVDEAIERERIWNSRGELELLLHLEAQLIDAAGRTDLASVHSNYANTELPDIRRRIAEFTGKRIH